MGPLAMSPNRASRRAFRARSTSDSCGDRGADGPLRQMAGAVLDELLELHHRVDEAFWPRWAAGHVDIHGHEPVDALDGAVAALVATTGAGAVAHRDAPLGFGHLLPEPDERAGHLRRERACHDQHVRLPGRCPEREHAPAVHVVLRGRRAPRLYRAAGP